MLASTERAASAIHARMEMAESRSRKATANFSQREVTDANRRTKQEQRPNDGAASTMLCSHEHCRVATEFDKAKLVWTMPCKEEENEVKPSANELARFAEVRTDGAARAISNSFEYCRVVTEVDKRSRRSTTVKVNDS